MLLYTQLYTKKQGTLSCLTCGLVATSCFLVLVWFFFWDAAVLPHFALPSFCVVLCFLLLLFEALSPSIPSMPFFTWTSPITSSSSYIHFEYLIIISDLLFPYLCRGISCQLLSWPLSSSILLKCILALPFVVFCKAAASSRNSLVLSVCQTCLMTSFK